MQPRFPLGKLTVKEDAALALELAAQTADFFLEKHTSGDWGHADPQQYEKELQEGGIILSKYRTLRGHEILVFTSFAEGETYLFCPPNSIVNHIPLPDLACWRKPEEQHMQDQSGNGSSRFEIVRQDMGGWVRVFAVGAALPNDLAVFLSGELAQWFRQRPQNRLTSVVPITRDGTTVELHAWYECHLFPATPECPVK